MRSDSSNRNAMLCILNDVENAILDAGKDLPPEIQELLFRTCSAASERVAMAQASAHSYDFGHKMRIYVGTEGGDVLSGVLTMGAAKALIEAMTVAITRSGSR